MHIGCLATIEAAEEVYPYLNNPGKTFQAMFYTAVPRIMGEIMVKEKLSPSLGERGRKVHGVTDGHEDRIVDDVVLGETESVSNPDAVDEYAGDEMDMDYAFVEGGLEWLIEKARLSFNQHEVLRLRYGWGGDRPKSLKEIRAAVGKTKQRIHQLEQDGLNKLGAAFNRFSLPTRPEPSQPQPTHDPIALQRQWLEEIKIKQEAGEIAFVKGSLQERFLPSSVQAYLIQGSYDGEFGAAGLQIALKVAKVRKEREERNDRARLDEGV